MRVRNKVTDMMEGWKEGFDVRWRLLAAGAEVRLTRRLARRIAAGSAATWSGVGQGSG